MAHRVPFLVLRNVEDVFDSYVKPAALLVDLEGTLTGFSPSPTSVVEAVLRFDEIAAKRGLDLGRVHYVTNAKLVVQCPRISCRVHSHGHKPFFTPPAELRYGYRTIVLGDQYLTDGLLAWRFGFSFGLVGAVFEHRPLWPRLQLYIGGALSTLFFKKT